MQNADMGSYLEKVMWHEAATTEVIPPALMMPEETFSKMYAAAATSSLLFKVAPFPEYQSAITQVLPHVLDTAIQPSLVFNQVLDQKYNLIYQNELIKTFLWGRKRKIFSKFYGSNAAKIFKNAPLFSKEILIPPFKEETHQEEGVIILPETIKVEHNRIKHLIHDIYKDNKLFQEIHHRDFEEVMAELLQQKGYDVELTKRTRDGGHDIIALCTLQGNIPIKMLVECKRWTNKVNVDIIRSFKHIVSSRNANIGMIATTSFFTPDAQKENLEHFLHLNLKDRNDLLQWIDEYAKGAK